MPKIYRILLTTPFSEYVRYKRDEILGKHFSCLYDQIGSRLPDKSLETAKSTGRFDEIEMRVRKDGTKFMASVSIRPVYDDKKQLIGFAEVLRDVSDQYARDCELLRSNSDLEQFAYIAAHDLQEPLRTITSYLYLLSQRYQGIIDTKADKYIANAVNGAKRMQILISDLLTYSRISTRPRELRDVDCNAVFDSVAKSMSVLIEQSNSKLTRASLPTIKADELQITQLFQNLLANAIKYRSDRPLEVSVSVSRNANGWLFAVKDNGIGFEMEYAERIFSIFQRLHSRTEYEGTGMGLAICKKITERHGGRIWAEAEAGKGSSFFFMIPTPGGSDIG